MAVWDFHRAPWRNRPAFCMDVRITYEDGSVEVVSTERDWKTSSGALILIAFIQPSITTPFGTERLEYREL